MRNGVLVEEGAPQDIISKYEADSLESAFLTICSYQDTNEDPTVRLYPYKYLSFFIMLHFNAHGEIAVFVNRNYVKGVTKMVCF